MEFSMFSLPIYGTEMFDISFIPWLDGISSHSIPVPLFSFRLSPV